MKLEVMDTGLKKEIKNYVEQTLQKELEKYLKLYSKEELLTRTEFLKAMELIQQRFEAADKRFEAADKRFEALIEAMNRGFLTLKASIDS